MNESDRQLQRWYEGEVAGAAFFDALASAAQNDGEADKWRLLGHLESTMAERLSPAVRSLLHLWSRNPISASSREQPGVGR